MNGLQHRRFQDYLELRSYFPKQGAKRLDAETFEAFDTELNDLLEKERTGIVTGDDERRIAMLRRVLFRD